MDLLEQREAEYQAALAKQAALRREEARKNREAVSQAAQKQISEVLDDIPLPVRQEVVDTRSDFDLVRDVFRESHPGAAAALKEEQYKRRRAELTSTKDKPTETEIAAAQETVDRIYNWYDSLENDDDDEDAWDED